MGWGSKLLLILVLGLEIGGFEADDGERERV